ncbi:MAG: helix-turn-helix domain-containing protein [Thermoguttaceae bacterium]
MYARNQALGALTPELLTTAEAARLCGLGERTFWRHAHSGAAPAPVRIGGSTRYRRSDLLEWIKNRCPRCDGGQGHE